MFATLTEYKDKGKLQH